MTGTKRTVLITGCSDGGMGAELAKELHRAGLQVYATARDLSKMKGVAEYGIQTLLLDVQSASSIRECVAKVPHLDILVNNAGATYTMPIADLSLDEARTMFDLNVWGQIATIQAFLPLLLKSSNGLIVNHTSVGAGSPIPFQSVYNASKAALSMFTQTLRMELQPFGIKVTELRTGGVKTNVANNLQQRQPQLPEKSIYSPARELVQRALRNEWFAENDIGIPAEQWAKEVTRDLLKASIPSIIWRGESVRVARFAGLFPYGWFDNYIRKLVGLDRMEPILRQT